MSFRFEYLWWPHWSKTKCQNVCYLLYWLNRTICMSISRILNMKVGMFPLKYLGALISPKRLPLGHYQGLIDKASNFVSSWIHFPLSYAGEVTLINSSLFSIPSYALSYCFVPDSILNQITKLVRCLFWSRCSNGSGVYNIAWNNTTLVKSEGGLRIQNLKHVRIVLMVKNVFWILIGTNKLWDDIFGLKYVQFDPWN